MSGSWETILDIIPANLYCMVSGGYKLITVVRDEIEVYRRIGYDLW